MLSLDTCTMHLVVDQEYRQVRKATSMPSASKACWHLESLESWRPSWLASASVVSVLVHTILVRLPGSQVQLELVQKILLPISAYCRQFRFQ